jgi:ubiquinone/menaquinone biosynthesis C-methylase UbiE
MNPNQQFIDGSWYDEEYQSRWYKMQYIDSEYPQWAKEADTYGVRFMAMCSGIPLTAKVLDCGSGVGRIMQTWWGNGFYNIWGIEISKIACEARVALFKYTKNLIHGSVQSMPMFGDNEFDLLSSFALLEHIDESILGDVLSEMSRVSKKQAHFIAHEAGKDPSHINIKSPQEWIDVFNKHTDSQVQTFCIPNPLIDQSPLYLIMPQDELTEPIRHRLAH